MPPRRSNTGVRGPASALTSFLAGLGVEPPAHLTTWGDTSALNINSNPPIDPGAVVTAQNVEAGPTEPEPPRKRARASSIDSDDLDTPAANRPEVAPEPLKAVGEFMQCGECARRFTVTAYTKEHPQQPSTYLCVQCCYAVGIDPFAKPKKPKAKAAGKKDDRAKITHYETRKGAPTLNDLCIKMIGSYIEDVDQLGDIGSINMDRVCRIISKSRKLTPETAPLFYSVDRKELAMYDCTSLTPSSYLALAKLCPNLETLRLDLCGQMTSAVIEDWATSLPRLKHLELYGPFLVRKDAWITFFESTSLESFLITQSPRIDLDVINAMVKSCNLTSLRLSEVGQLTDELLPALSSLKGLRSLDLSRPGAPLTDDTVGELLAAIGAGLEVLDISDTGLTDAVLPAIAKHCPELKEISMSHLDLDDEVVDAFFKSLSESSRPGFRKIVMDKGHDLQDRALDAILAHSGSTLQHLGIVGWKEVGPEALSRLGQCKNLVSLDIGWCRQVTDFVLKDILDGCERVETIRVWGCNQLTDAVPRKRGVKVIGIETHAI